MDNVKENSYFKVFETIKRRIHNSRYKALRSVNKELISLYWDIGKMISLKKEKEGWGKSVVQKLSKDLQAEFPGVKGYSIRNLWYMSDFYSTYSSNEKMQQLVAEIGWSHNIILMQKCKDVIERKFYIDETIKNGWSRSDLVKYIKSDLFQNYRNNQTNFNETLDHAELGEALWAVKDEYSFEYLEIEEPIKERILEEALVSNIVKFLSDMGGEFCFVGRQYRVEIDEKEYFIDLLFYHRGLKSLIAVELKTVEFKFEHTGQMAGYLAILDSEVRKPGENKSIGIIICKHKNRTIVEYALSGINSPIGVATFKYKDLPGKIAKYLPTDEEIERRLSD